MVPVVNCGIEVQPYLQRSAKDLPKEVFDLFAEELSKLGYCSTDTFIGGKCGDNCRLLDSYKDADCKDVEKLPEWFKQTPLVLVDRDRIYPKDEQYIRQLTTGY